MRSRGVLVLLATYNGERYLRAQIDSILTQTYTEVRVLARDDGSSDGTVAILAEYAQRWPMRFGMVVGEVPTGSARGNFLRLMGLALADAAVDYVAFADQDDVWLAEKLAVEMAVMQGLEQKRGATQPLLVFSDAQVVDAELAMLNPSLWAQQFADPVWIERLQRILSQNVVAGCTSVINRPLAELAVRMPQEAVMHDWWIALLACAFGGAAWVRKPTVQYRQHERNVVGAEAADRRWNVPVWRRHGLRREQWEQTERQAAGLLRVHGAEMTEPQRALLRAYLRCGTAPNRWVRVSVWLRHGFFPHGLKPVLARLWYLWDGRALKRGTGKR